MKIFWLLVLFIGLPVGVIGLLFLIGCRNINNYLENIIYLEHFIKDRDVTWDNYNIIISEFTEIQRNNRDPYRTERAWNRFRTKYKALDNDLLIGPKGFITRVVALHQKLKN